MTNSKAQQRYNCFREDGSLFIGLPGEPTLTECSVYSIAEKKFTRLNPSHDQLMLGLAVMRAMPDRTEEILGGDRKEFISRDRDHWLEPSRDGILRAALQEALNYATKNEIPPDEIMKVWELILKDTKGP